jgi:general secretion pathway protein J
VSRRASACRADEAGFTVVEVLVAFTLFSLLSVLVVGSLRFGVKSWERSNEHGSRLDETIHAQALLRRLIGTAYPSFVTLPSGAGYVDFEGDSGSVTFLAEGPMSLDYSGRLRFTLSTDQHNGQTNIMLSSRPELEHAEGSTLFARRTLLSKVEGLAISYFGVKRGGGPAQWHEEWRREREPPEMLRIKVKFASGDTGAWSDVIIRPRVEADVSCVYDLLAKRCRGR